MKILFVVTARGGSKGVPKKNIREVGGLPLLAYKIIAARKCKYNHRIILTTDDTEIAEIGLKYGAEVPFIRPHYLATDEADSMDVVEHAVNWVKQNDEDKYEYICLLEPSSPFASYKDINAAIELIEKSKADTLLGMKEVEVSKDFINVLDAEGKLSEFYKNIRKMKSVRRQEQKPQYTMNGCMYIARWEYFEKNKLFHSMNSVPYIMPKEMSIEIDDVWDYKLACWMVDNDLIDLAMWRI